MVPPPDPDPFDAPQMVPSTDGVRVATYDVGGEGPDLLFVHATGFCGGVWAPLAEHLTGLHRAALDVRGHGRSSVPTGAMSWAGTGDDVLVTVDALGLVRPIGVGHSLGGASLLMAELSRPGTFGRLWLFEPIVFPTTPVPAASAADGPNPMAEAARRRRPDFPSRRAAIEHYAVKAPLNELDPASLAAYVRYGFDERSDGTVTLRCRPEVEAATFEMGAEHRTWDRLGGVRCPVTIVRGRADGFGPATLAPGIVERLPRGRLEDHPDLGHFGPLQDLPGMAASVRATVTGTA